MCARINFVRLFGESSLYVCVREGGMYAYTHVHVNT